MVLSLALLLSCVSGITLFTAAEELPAPFGLFDFTGTDGATRASGNGICVRYINENGENNPDIETGTAIGDTGLYGYTVATSGYGLYVGGKILNKVPDNTDILYAVEYYIDSETKLTNTTLRVNGGDGALSYGNLPVGQKGVALYYLPAAKVDEIQANVSGGDTRVRIYIDGEGVGKLYVTGFKILDAKYASTPLDPGYAYYDAGTVGACTYFPDIPAAAASNISTLDAEITATFAGYRYFKIYGDAASTDKTVNKPVYVKLYANAGYENATVSIGEFEVSNGTTSGWRSANGYAAPSVIMKNGVGGVYLPKTCFRNSLNGNGSLRLGMADANKVRRIEVYDVNTYCVGDNATAEMKAELHAAMLASNHNITETDDGIFCAVCGDVIKTKTVYAQIDFNNPNGAVTTAATVIGAHGSAPLPSLTPAQIPGTEDYALAIPTHNSGIQFKLDTSVLKIKEADLANGKELAVSVEYYLASSQPNATRITFISNGSKNVALYGKWENTCWDSMCVNQGVALTRGKTDVATFTIGKDVTYHAPAGQWSGEDKITEPVDAETFTFAKNLVNGNTITMYGWGSPNAANPIYIKSITVYAADELVEPDVAEGSDYIVFEHAASPVYYPQYASKVANNITVNYDRAIEYYKQDTAEEYGRFNYGYVILGNNSAVKTADGVVKPAEIRITRKAGSNLSRVMFQYQTGVGATWSDMIQLPFGESDTVTYIAKDAVFQNQLNGESSIRLRDDHYVQSGSAEEGYTYSLNTKDDIDYIAKIEILPYEGCIHANTTLTGKEDADCVTDGYTGDLICDACGETVEEGEVIPAKGHDEGTLEGKVDADCNNDGYTGDLICGVCGETVEEGEVIPANGHDEGTLEGKVDADCNNDGYTGDLICGVCGETIEEGEVIPANGHDEGTLEGKVDADCVTDGYTGDLICGVCGETIEEGEVIPAHGHDEGTLEGKVDADCVTDGYTGDLICGICGETIEEGEVIPANGHDEGTLEGKVDADCVNDGYTGDLICGICGETIEEGEVIPANGHDEGTLEGKVDADCVTDGYTGDLICGVCGETIEEGEVIPANGHDEGTLEGKVDADCVTDGYTGDLVCGVCGETIEEGEVIPAEGHDEGTLEGKVDADCVTDGYTGDLVCGVCGETIEEGEVIPAEGHDEGVLEGAKDATTAAPGYTGDLVCGKCGELLEEGEVIPQIEVTLKDGFYYEDDELTSYAGLIAYEGNIYYIGSYSRAVTGRYFVSNLNGMEGFEKGYYYFGKDGALVTENGVYEGFYYEGGRAVSYAGAVEADGNVYYVQVNGALKTGRYAPVTLNGILASGIYYFGEDGALQKNVVAGGFYYGNDGRCVAYRGLVEVDGAYYYVAANGAVITNNAQFFVTTTNGYVAKGLYAFGADGKMIVD